MVIDELIVCSSCSAPTPFGEICGCQSVVRTLRSSFPFPIEVGVGAVYMGPEYDYFMVSPVDSGISITRWQILHIDGEDSPVNFEIGVAKSLDEMVAIIKRELYGG